VTQEKDKLETINRLVVVFDIINSTAIVEALNEPHLFRKWRNLQVAVKNYLFHYAEKNKKKFNIYQFTGDGWILLFDPQKTASDDLIAFVDGLRVAYEKAFRSKIVPILPVVIESGICFGIEHGQVHKIIMNKKNEYVGRAINVACRLQGAIDRVIGKGRGRAKKSLALVSPDVHNTYFKNSNINSIGVEAVLKNVVNGVPFRCHLLNFSNRHVRLPAKDGVQELLLRHRLRS
jgi:hypothetical protein